MQRKLLKNGNTVKQGHIWRSEGTAFILLDHLLKHWEHSFFLLQLSSLTEFPHMHRPLSQELFSGWKGRTQRSPADSHAHRRAQSQLLVWQSLCHGMPWLCLFLKHLLAIFCHPPPYPSASMFSQPPSSIYPFLEARETCQGDTALPSTGKHHQPSPSTHKSLYHRPFSLCTQPGPRTNFFVTWRSKREGERVSQALTEVNEQDQTSNLGKQNTENGIDCRLTLTMNNCALMCT